MKRFQIQDIVHQTADGITYLATYKESGEKVALRRFFPYGPSGSGLDAESSERFLALCERLKEVKHPAARTVLDAFVDPFDGMPCIATEWIEGKPLPATLNGEKLEAEKLIKLTRKAIEVSMALSEVIGEEAVWIDTTDRSIVVEPNDPDRAFTFWVCPFRCLGLYPLSTGIDSLADLIEEIAGWKSTLYSKQTGLGLGEWVKAMKQAPQTSLQDALDALPQTEAAEPVVAEPIVPEAPRITVSPRPGSTPAPEPTPAATTAQSTTAQSTTAQSTTAQSTTAKSTTAQSTTAQSTTAQSTTAQSTTA